MDFASAPLQSLLSDNVGPSELKSYIQQLHGQFRSTVDEKDRFGTLQILLPVLHAHLGKTVDHLQDTEDCLNTVLRPLVLSTLAHDSMISTESVSLVSKTAAHFTLASLSLASSHQQQQQGTKDEVGHDSIAPDIYGPGFGYTLLRTLVGQLALVMDIEPDFVDLKPIAFITENVKGTPAQELWKDVQTTVNKLKQSCQRRYKSRISMLQDDDDDDNGDDDGDDDDDHTDDGVSNTNSSMYGGGVDDGSSIISGLSFNTTTTMRTKMTLSDFTSMGLLDLEYCLDLMEHFVLEARLYQHQEGSHDDGTDHQLAPWLDLLLIISIAMLPCTNSTIRSKLINDFVPTLLSWKKGAVPEESDFSASCQVLWTRTLQVFRLPATNLLRTETYGLIAKFFDTYFGLDPLSSSTIDASMAPPLDLRYNEDFFVIIQSGLRSDDCLTRKYTSFILKRLVDFTRKHETSSLAEHPRQWTKYFEWSASKSDDYMNLWDDWFLLYDIMHESVIHLVEPVLNRFETLLGSLSPIPCLDASWWTLLLYRGFRNETRAVQIAIWEYIFARQAPETLTQLASQPQFFFGAFMKSIDNTSIFSVVNQGVMVSPFGEHLKVFMQRIVANFKSIDDKGRFLRQMIHHLAHVVKSPILILYVMESLAESGPTPCWDGDALKSLRYLVDRHRHFDIKCRKQFLRKLGLAALVRFGDPAKLSFSDVAKTTSSLITDYNLSSSSDEYKSLKSWFEQKVMKEKALENMVQDLKKKVGTFVCEQMSQDAPVEILRIQANVLAKTSLFLISNNNGMPDFGTISTLFAGMSEHLLNPASSVSTFNRQLVLLDSLWASSEVCFGPITDIESFMKWETPLSAHILERIESQLIDIKNPNETDEVLVELLLSVLQRILSPTHTCFSQELKHELLERYSAVSLKLLYARDKELTSYNQLAKITYLRLLGKVYHLGHQMDLQGLKIDSTIIATISDITIKRTPDLIRYRSWGDTMATFIRYKWECLGSLVIYGQRNPGAFKPEPLYKLAIDQLESASDICAGAILECIAALLDMPWDKHADSVMTCVEYTLSIIKDYVSSLKTTSILIQSLLRVVLQPCLLSKPELNEEDGPLKKALHKIIEFGEWKSMVVGESALLLHSFWSTYTVESNASMLSHVKEIATLLVFGPMRDREDQKLDAAVSLKLQFPNTISSTEGTAEMVLNQNDYYVRVLMNDLLLRLDDTNDQHIEFVDRLMDHMMESNERHELYEGVYTNTALHRFKIRSWCSMLLVSRFIRKDASRQYLERIFGMMQKETDVSVRSYMEWAVVRLVLQFPEQLALIYQQLEKADAKPSYIISVLTVTFFLGEALLEQEVAGYFNKIFPLLAPWMIPNHFNVRMYAFCSWQRNWDAYRARGLDLGLENNPYVPIMAAFMKQNGDCIKLSEKIKTHYFMATFDPVDDYNLEYIFRENLHVFGVLENERISSRSFIRVNPIPTTHCPFVNPNRVFVYSAADASELLGGDMNEGTAATGDGSYQKKITPWEMMLETDVDLTKTLAREKRRRNDIIVVASLVNRIPNLAGLCRTCEIFNASQLVVHNLKIKEDPSFTAVSVSSEKWMPMTEVQQPELANFLRQKKDEGYVLCGLEQTTNSKKLGDYEFPEKCVLLLGKEKEGIPADLLQLLDHTIEIPQYGFIRSLNVHVSGSLLLYEYTKQMQWRCQSMIHNAGSL